MGEPVMTETATLSLGGIEGWDGSQRSERDTLIRADQSKHHNPPEGNVLSLFVFAWVFDIG